MCNTCTSNPHPKNVVLNLTKPIFEVDNIKIFIITLYGVNYNII